MALETMHIPEITRLTPNITVFGVGGAGCNAVQNMKDKGLQGVNFVIANTDAQALSASSVEKKIQLGPKRTQGLGAGSSPHVGRESAIESTEEIREHLEGVHMLFVTAGMGGGTGTGAAPEIAMIAQEMRILTVGVVTKPFLFEGQKRMDAADTGIAALRKVINASVIIPNQNLFDISNEKTTAAEAFMRADDVLYEGVKSITDLMVRPGRINLDFADVRAVMEQMGSAMMGIGEDSGVNRAEVAAHRAMTNQLLEDTGLSNAKGVLVNIIGGDDLMLHDLNAASEVIKQHTNPHATIIFGSTTDPEYNGKVKVSLLAAGLSCEDFDQNNQPLHTELPSNEDLWNKPIQQEEGLAQECEEEYPNDSFKPNADYPHIQEAARTRQSQTTSTWPTVHESEPDQSKPEAAENEGVVHKFVAPKTSNFNYSEPRQPAASSEFNANSYISPESITENQPSGRGLSALVRRMKPSSEPANQFSPTTSQVFSAHSSRAQHSSDNEDMEPERSIPAYMRRQAN